MPELDEQLRMFFDATAPAVEPWRRSNEPSLIVPTEAPVRFLRRRRGSLVAAAMIAIVAAAAFLLLQTKETPVRLDTVDNTTVNETIDNDADDAVDAPEELRAARLIAPGSWSVAAAMPGDASAAQLEAAAREIQSWPEVLEVAVAADAEAWRRLTGFESDECSSGAEQPPCNPGVVVLVVQGSAELVTRRLESDLSMTAIAAHRDPWGSASAYFSAAIEVASPVPVRFDPSRLGREVVLGGPYLDVTDAAGCPVSTCAVGVDLDFEGSTVGLSVAIVRPGQEGEATIPPGSGLLLGMAGGVAYRNPVELLPGEGGAATVAGVLGSELTAHRQWFAVVGLPLEVAVVSVELTDGSTVWQRPLAGMAFLFDESDTSTENENSTSTMLAFDADGNVILRIAGGPNSDVVVTDLRVDEVRPEATAAVVTPSQDDLAGLTVSWTEATWGAEGSALHDLVGTRSGILGVNRSRSVVRWLDGTHWEPIVELAEVEVDSLVGDVEFVLAAGLSRVDGRQVLMRSVDGAAWSEIDRTTHQGLGTDIMATSPSGLTLTDRGRAFVIEGDQVTSRHAVPWSRSAVVDSVELVEFDGSVVAYEDDTNLASVGSAWRYLGDGEWAAPVAVPVSSNIEVVNGLVLTFDGTGSMGADCCAPPVGAESMATLLTSTDGTNWTTQASLINPTTNGLQIEAGAFFWLYGLQGFGGPGMQRYEEFATLWISSDAASWQPLDISFTPIHSAVFVAGDTIFIIGATLDADADRYWIGRVEISG